MTTETVSAENLRDGMVEKVRGMGYAQRPAVRQVLRTMPRHDFVPEADLDTAYHPYRAVTTHRFDDGSSLSCASAPFVVAMMLDQLDVRPGDRVLEIGAGTGYNAALLAELTGDAGTVTTIDVDSEVTGQAARNLDAAGYRQVRVVTGDGTNGVPEHGPYDKIIATVSPWDIPNSWWRQLAPGGRIVLPLRWRGQARSVTFAEHDGRLIADGIELCGFVPMAGETEGEQSASITTDGTVSLHWDRDQEVNPDQLAGVLDQPRTIAWSGVTIAGDEPHDVIWLRMTERDTRTCRINAHPEVNREVCDPVSSLCAPALVDGASLAYLTIQRHDNGDETRWELGAIGHGPDADALTTHLIEGVHAWAPERERQPRITVYPAETPDKELEAGTVIEKKTTRLMLSYMDAH